MEKNKLVMFKGISQVNLRLKTTTFSAKYYLTKKPSKNINIAKIYSTSMAGWKTVTRKTIK